jgi:hypothetical protein
MRDFELKTLEQILVGIEICVPLGNFFSWLIDKKIDPFLHVVWRTVRTIGSKWRKKTL